MRISDWSSDVCSSDLALHGRIVDQFISDLGNASLHRDIELEIGGKFFQPLLSLRTQRMGGVFSHLPKQLVQAANNGVGERSEEHTSELQSLMRISYAVFCLKKKK